MASEPDQSEKTEQASPYKLREAKKKGSVSKSNEVNAAVAIAAGLFLLLSLGLSFIHNVLDLCAGLLAQAGKMPTGLNDVADFFGYWVSQAMLVLSPIVIVMMVVGVIATVLQTGLVFSSTPLKPDLKRLDPIKGIKKLFNIKLLYEVIRSIIKLFVFAVIAAWTIYGEFDQIQKLALLTIESHIPIFLNLAGLLIFRLLIALILFAVIDFLFTRWQFMKQMRMTKKEVKDEYKQREGDPKVKAKRKELEKELRQRSQSVSSVPDADLVITNPTHYAVVIKYNRATMPAPCVTGKGADEMARVIRQEAKRYRVPVISSPTLARALYRRTNVNQIIGQQFFVDVARLLRKVYQERAQKALNGS